MRFADWRLVVQLNQSEQRQTRNALAKRDGAIVPMVGLDEALDTRIATTFANEQHLCVNTTAAGGNAELMTQSGVGRRCYFAFANTCRYFSAFSVFPMRDAMLSNAVSISGRRFCRFRIQRK